MTRTLPPILNRLLALAILFALIAVVWAGVAQPVADRMLAYRETVEQAEEQLPRLRRIAASAPMLEAQLAQIKRDPAARSRQLSGASDALAAADLQNRVSRLAGDQGIVLRSTQILPPVDEEGFRRIGIRIALESDTAALQKIFYALESAVTLLFIDNVEVRARSGGRIVRQRNGVKAPNDVLFVRFDLIGYTAGAKP